MRLWGKRAGSAPERMDIAEQIRTDPEGGSRRLVAELGAGLWALALRLCGNRADAEDLYVRTLETAVAKIAEQRGPFFSAWLRAICLNLRRSDLRRADLPADRSVAPESIPGESPTPLDETAARADAAAAAATHDEQAHERLVGGHRQRAGRRERRHDSAVDRRVVRDREVARVRERRVRCERCGGEEEEREEPFHAWKVRRNGQ